MQEQAQEQCFDFEYRKEIQTQ